MRHLFVLLAVSSLFGCYRAVQHHRKEKAVTTIQTRETFVPTYGYRQEIGSRDLIVTLSRDIECRQVADVDVEYENVTTYREYNWPKIPFFTGLGVGAVTAGTGLLLASGPFDDDGGWIAVAAGAGIAGIGAIFGLVHAIAPEDIEDSTLSAPRREERIVQKTPACRTGPVADEAVQLVTNSGKKLELRTDAEGRISIPLERLSHLSILEGDLGMLELAYEGETISHRLVISDEMLVDLARAASKTPNPIPDRPLSVADSDLLDRAQRAVARSDCTSAVLALERASATAKENLRYLETYRTSLECAGRGDKAIRVAAAVQRIRPEPEPEEPKVVGMLVGATVNPLRDSVLAVFPIHFNLSRDLPKNDRTGLFQLYVASLGEQGVKMVPPSELKRLLATQKVDSFRECFDTNCQIELGKAMAATIALQTAVTPIGDTCIVTSTAFDLKTETSVRTAKRKAPCKTKALGDALEALAMDLGSN